MTTNNSLNWIYKLYPSVNKNLLYLVAGLMWSAVGVMLCWLAYGWLKPVPLENALLFATGGTLLAFAIFYFGFKNLANKNIRRIEAYTQDRVCLFAFQQWTSYPLVIVMISLGIFLRVYSPIPKPYLAIMYIGIGGSLFLASLLYYKRLFFHPSEDY